MSAKLLTEFLGTFFLVFVIALTGNPIAIWFMLMVMVYMGGHVSWAHYNPAITFGLWLKKKVTLTEMLNYRWVQLLAWIIAALLARWLTGTWFVAMPWDAATWLQAIVVEIIFTFALVLVVMNVAVSSKTKWNSFYWLAIWLTVLAAAFAWWPISWWAFNPAVWLGPIIFDVLQWWSNPQRWIYLVWPLLWWALAALVWGIQEGE